MIDHGLFNMNVTTTNANQTTLDSSSVPSLLVGTNTGATLYFQMFSNAGLNYVAVMDIAIATGQFTLNQMSMQNMSMGILNELGLEYYISTAAMNQNFKFSDQNVLVYVFVYYGITPLIATDIVSLA